MSSSAVRTFENIADAWNLASDDRARILGMPPSIYVHAKQYPEQARLSREQLERISHILGIYKALHILLPRADVADGWLDLPNRDFGGEPAKRMLTSGRYRDLVQLRDYLDTQVGGAEASAEQMPKT